MLAFLAYCALCLEVTNLSCEGFLKVFDLLLHLTNPVCQEHGLEPMCPVVLATFIDLARTYVRDGRTFELAQTELCLKCGALAVEKRRRSSPCHFFTHFSVTESFHVSSGFFT